MGLHKFTIRAPLNQHEAVVEIDGKPLAGVCRVSFDLNPNSRPTTLYLQVVGEVEIEGEFQDEDIIALRRELSAAER